ncbi:hypothetical protein Bca101_050627 [Brassica carinata]
MSGSIDLKTKRPIEDDYGRTPEEVKLLEEMEKKALFNVKAEKERLQAKLLLGNENLATVKVPYIDWDKIGKSFMFKL